MPFLQNCNMAAKYRRTESDDHFEFIEETDLLQLKLTDGTNPEITNQKLQQQMSSPKCKRTEALTLDRYKQFIDSDGRLVDESALRKAVFLGGVEHSARKDVWQFLFGLYPCSSTKREREALLLDYILKYHEMKSRWKTLLVLSAKPGASEYEQGLIARYQLEESDKDIKSPDLDVKDPIADAVAQQAFETGSQRSFETGNQQIQNGEPDFSALSKNSNSLDLDSEETRQNIEFLKIQAQVYVNRHKINIRDTKSFLRIIDKDVPRTDRDFDYFNGPKNTHLSNLRDILITYATFHPDINYAQGMNDILARFLVVFDSEVEAYWCFTNYLEKIKEDFTEHGMVQKIEQVRRLLLEMDQELLTHFENHELGDLLFCHRWLLLGFKREFSFMDSITVFEILSSHHLELSSLEAETARRRQQMKEFAEIGGMTRTTPTESKANYTFELFMCVASLQMCGMTRTTPIESEANYTFELFMCVALLQMCKSKLMQCTDAAMVFSIINNLKIDLDNILVKSEELFFRYCKKNVEESFQMVDDSTKR